ncbi:hypothetical protein ACFQRL_06620 [Microbacterium fluvii]|uniref:Uncharacterized protein n=1 Tax=Microbacterium fluvii TaxID=415215 RepID=A0ABW2HDQ7_9MICO|nr:hypothetical protein [Microbacterium fluvii]MCU4672258.1 hypothetical protein [Microbacterium fluvii]
MTEARSAGLSAGPRGRRLLLELTREADPEVGRLMGDLSYNAALASGASITRFGWDEHGTPFTDTSRQPVPVDHTIDDLAARVRGVGTLDPEAGALEEALRRSVDAAAYWQPLDGDDLVAAEPAVRAALDEIGHGLAAHPSAAWWRRVRTPEQWAVEFDPIDDGAPFDPAAGAAAAWSVDTREEERRAAAERPVDPAANWSGTWWSFPTGAPASTGLLPSGVPAGIPMLEDGFGATRAVAVPVRGGGRTFEIVGADDWVELCRRHPLQATASRRHDWYRATGRDGGWLLPDWGAVAQEWDAVHLTAWAYLTAAGRAIEVDDGWASVIAGWGPDQTYWLGGRVREVEGPRVHLRADDVEDRIVWR